MPEQENAAIARRLREVRLSEYGEHGVPGLARELGVPVRTWMNYEAGVTVPAPVVLRFIWLTGASPGWLLSGRGDNFSGSGSPLPG